MPKSSSENTTRTERQGRSVSAGALIAIIAAALLAIAALLWFTALRGISDKRVEAPPAQTPSAAAADGQDESPAAPPQIVTATDPEPPAQTEPADAPEADEPDGDASVQPAGAFDGAPAAETDATQTLNLQLYSENAILIDVETNTVIAEKAPDARIYPASMTKIMTALVACEQIENWDDTFRMTQTIIDPLYLADATLAGFVNGEDVNMLDLVYGTILPSGAEATEALAIQLAGSEEAFVELMNEKAAELGLQDTHFVDASGLHDEEHYTTVRDMSIILRAAMENEVCRQVLSTASYTSASTEQHPDGVDMYNKFLLRIASADQNGAQIQGAKTGYTAQAMNCCASFGRSPSGRQLLCVTAHAWTGDFCIEDHIALYSTYNGE